MTHPVTIKSTAQITHNVDRLTVERPDGYEFTPGHATDVHVDKPGWEDEDRPFTFTGLTDAPDLEFTIKIYPSHDGVTEQIDRLEAGDRLVLDDPWGTIDYKGKGTFIAAGAGVTPFIAILRDLNAKDQIGGHRLIFTNKSEKDIILKEEWDAMEGLETLYTLTDQPESPHAIGRIDRTFLSQHVADFDQHFYICGPEAFVGDIKSALLDLGAKEDRIVFEDGMDG
ncbi:FAD-binding oxidoreductase [Notoacmeibacter ruber]|uniref:Flavodoxin reductase n=1 Tax=Notoacmeibacter ruber TaxID=2670375 RepID=A0A3L7J9E3_9HYPH|nr:FAD-binding oxidoreductase [Notoacmeibacter ruber]RLQ86985.1 flavodoxin reductase [Notoacmeibacter ruber]